MNAPLEQALLEKLVAIPSVTGNLPANDEVLDVIDTFLQERGMHIVRKTYGGFGTLVATSRPTKNPKVMLIAHCDVVPAQEKQFTLRRVGEKLVGRGAWDMKFAIASYMALVERLRGKLNEYDFGIMIVSDEEELDLGVGNLLKDGFVPEAAVLLDGAADWRVESRAKGAWYVNVTVTGKTAHGSRPWLGDSASMKLLDLLAEIRQLFDPYDPNNDTLNISILSSGEKPNQVPDHAQATLDVRFISDESHEKTSKAILSLCEKYGAAVEVRNFFPPLKHDLENVYFSKFIASVESVRNNLHTDTLSYGASSAVHLVPLGIPCIVTQPTGGDRHGPDEWIDIGSFLQTVPILEEYLTKVAHFAN